MTIKAIQYCMAFLLLENKKNKDNNMAQEKMDGLKSELSSYINDFGNLGKEYISLEKILPKIDEALGDQASTIRSLNKEFGATSRTSAEFRKNMQALAKTTGLSLNSQIELLNATKSYHKLLSENVTKSTLQFQKATGASVEIIGKLSAHIKALGASDKVFEKMYKNILSVRDAYGLTNDEINDVSQALINYVNVIGHSDTKTAKAAQSIAIFTTKLKSAGVEANVVTQTLNDMLDPNKISENLMLYTKMGMTMSDLTIGDPTEKLEASLPKLKEIGVKITSEQNRIVANQMAKVYGITLETAREFAKIDTSKIALERNKTLEQYRAETETFKESIGNLATIATGFVGDFLSPWAQTAEKIVGTLSESAIGRSGLVFGTMFLTKLVAGGLRDVIFKIFEKPAANIEEKVKEVARGTDNIKEIRDILFNYFRTKGISSEYIGEAGVRDAQRNADINGIRGNVNNGVFSSLAGKTSYFSTRSDFVEGGIRRQRADFDRASADYSYENIEHLKNTVLGLSSGLEEEIDALSKISAKTDIENLRYNSLLTMQESWNKRKNSLANGISGGASGLSSRYNAYTNMMSSASAVLSSGNQESINGTAAGNIFSMMMGLDTSGNSNGAMEELFGKLENGVDGAYFLKNGSDYRSALTGMSNILSGLGLSDENLKTLNGLINTELGVLNSNNEDITSAFKKAEKEINEMRKEVESTVRDVNRGSVMRSFASGASGILNKFGIKGMLISAGIGLGTTLLKASGVQDFIDNKLINPINNFFSKINDKVTKSLNVQEQIEENTSGFDLKTMTLAYTNADLVKNNQVVESLEKLETLMRTQNRLTEENGLIAFTSVAKG